MSCWVRQSGPRAVRIKRNRDKINEMNEAPNIDGPTTGAQLSQLKCVHLIEFGKEKDIPIAPQLEKGRATVESRSDDSRPMGMERRKKNVHTPTQQGGEKREKKKRGLDFRPMSERRRRRRYPSPHFLLAGITFLFSPPLIFFF